MIITNKKLTEVNSMIEDIIKEYKEENKPKAKNYYEKEKQYNERINYMVNSLKELTKEAVKNINILDYNKGRPKKLKPEDKIRLIIIKEYMGLSNKAMLH